MCPGFANEKHFLVLEQEGAWWVYEELDITGARKSDENAATGFRERSAKDKNAVSCTEVLIWLQLKAKQ